MRLGLGLLFPSMSALFQTRGSGTQLSSATCPVPVPPPPAPAAPNPWWTAVPTQPGELLVPNNWTWAQVANVVFLGAIRVCLLGVVVAAPNGSCCSSCLDGRSGQPDIPAAVLASLPAPLRACVRVQKAPRSRASRRPRTLPTGAGTGPASHLAHLVPITAAAASLGVRRLVTFAHATLP